MEKPIPDQQKDFELISRFHEFELTEEELQAFEQRLENDPVFQQRFRLYGEVDQQVDAQFSGTNTEEFRKVLRDHPKEKTKVRKLFSRQQWGMAASIALLLVAGLWWMLSPSVMKDPVALADYYWEATDKAYLFSGEQRGEDSGDPNEAAYTFFRSIRDYHEKGEYTTMIDQLEIYKTTTPEPIPFEDDADWLLAIAYVANDQLENAKYTLEQIIEAYPAKRQKARQLLQDIETLRAEGRVER
jgi:tetratricopeptide (TPR) repeat protein